MRRPVLLSGVLSLLLLFSLSTVLAAEIQGPEAANINWRQFEGETIRVLFVAHPWQQAIEPLIPEFEKLTGINVEVEVVAEDLFWDRSTLGLSSDNPPFDLTFLCLGPQGSGAYNNGWIQSFEPYLNDPTLTDKEWFKLDDFYPGYLAGFRLPKPDKGELYALPMAGEVYMNFYRKDLFEKAGINVAELHDMDDWLAAVEALNIDENGDGRIDIYGATIRGADAGIIDELNAMVKNYWGDAPYETDRFVYYKKDWTPRFTDKRIKEAFAAWAKLMRNSAPGVTAFSWYEATTQFAQGKAATYWADASLFAPLFEDPSKSKIAGKVGYAPLPPSKNGHGTALFSWGLAIPAKSQHKKAAYLFAQWATSPSIDMEVGKHTWAATRQSTWQSPEFQAVLPEGFGEAVADSLSIAVPSIIYLSSGPEVIMRMIDALHLLYQGNDLDQVMTNLNQEVTNILKRDGFIK
ncbi:MAG: sugar ABC transporter substrate-binding protein [Firmicutes bacterium]|nr:sugar ABC transporter substrate-binding protein [Bacillota bacterium]